MFGTKAEEKTKKIPLSNDIIRRDISDMSTNMQYNVISSVKQNIYNAS